MVHTGLDSRYVSLCRRRSLKLIYLIILCYHSHKCAACIFTTKKLIFEIVAKHHILSQYIQLTKNTNQIVLQAARFKSHIIRHVFSGTEYITYLIRYML